MSADEISMREFAVMTEQLRQSTAAVNKLVEALNGNGKPGLIREVDSIKDAIDSKCPENISERVHTIELTQKFIAGGLGFIAVKVGGDVISTLYTMLTHGGTIIKVP